jgi:5,10-methylenetetrahydromethanopterin reductase
MVKYGTQLSLDRPWGEIEKTADYATKLENLGYNSLWIPDERFERNPYSLLTIAALNTKEIRLGVSVTNPYTRHPLMTGATIATINEVSKGRAILGLGSGASSLFERHEMKRPYPATRAVQEAVEMLRPFLKGECFSYKGKTHSFSNVDLDFETHPIPIYIAARGPQLLKLAGEIADGVIIGSLASEDGCQYALDQIHKGLARSGRKREDIKIIFWAYTAISDKPDHARHLVEKLVVSSMWSSKGILERLGVTEDVWVPIEKIMREGFKKGFPAGKIYENAASMLNKELIDAWSLAGDVETVVERANGFFKKGIDELAILVLGKTLTDRMNMQMVFADKAIGR